MKETHLYIIGKLMKKTAEFMQFHETFVHFIFICYSVIQNQTESMRLLLRSGANPSIENNNGKSPLAISKERNHHLCEEMVIIDFTKNFQNAVTLAIAIE